MKQRRTCNTTKDRCLQEMLQILVRVRMMDEGQINSLLHSDDKTSRKNGMQDK
jgi:hypothetical protein